MGKPVRIYDLACHMAGLSGLELGKDIEMKSVGLRPGEK
ncbi:MAG: polysaccharide biosynthesis protein, partial [Geminicoccaceae bacterium]